MLYKDINLTCTWIYPDYEPYRPPIAFRRLGSYLSEVRKEPVAR